MVSHTCVNCNKEFNRKSNYDYHVYNKKNPCVKKINNIIINDDIKKIPEILPINEVQNSNQCLYCGLILSRKDHLTRHINNTCKVKKIKNEEKENIFKILLQKEKENEEQKETIKELKEIIKDQNDKINKILDKITTKNINKGIINNNNIVIASEKLLKFGEENIKNMDPNLFLTALNKIGKSCFIEMAKNIYNNPKYPENQNIYISDLSRNKFMAYDGKKWKLENRLKILSDIGDKLKQYIDMNETDLKDKLTNNQQFRNKFENNLKKYYNLYYEEDTKATRARIKQFQNLLDDNLIKFLYDIREDVKKNYNYLLEEAHKKSIKCN
jgi:hypothetical protein